MITSLYIVLSAALGASWALTVLCSLSYVFEIQMSCIRKIFCMASITALTLLLMCIFYDRAVSLRTIIVISYIFFFIYAEVKRKLTSKQKAHSLCCFAASLKYKSYDIEP